MDRGQEKLSSDRLPSREERIAIKGCRSSESLKAIIRQKIRLFLQQGWMLERISCTERFIHLHFLRSTTGSRS